MTRKCNFSCHYCYFPHDNSPVSDSLPVAALLDFLRSRGGEWLVGLTGGEPFIYPYFVDICSAIAAEHRIGIDTNLSVTPVVKRFARHVPPDRVHDIYAALHIEERERRGAVDAFIRNYHTLAGRGFTVKVNYVVHPSLVQRFAADCEFFGRHGIPLTPRPFKGVYEGRRYPEGYGSTAAAIFTQHPEAGRKTVFNFHGVPCHGGHTFLRMEPDGTVLRCPGDKTVLGNVLSGTVQTESGPTPCRMHRCPCQGVEHILPDAAQQDFIEGVRAYVVGDLPAAQRAFTAAHSRAPAMTQAANNAGVAAFAAGDAQAAACCFARAAADDPVTPLYAANLKLARRAAQPSPPSGTENETPELSLAVNYQRTGN
ncbi:Radical SAM domain protein [Oleidesulfovibrio alaskensis G20]|jgi:hypothetical protein|uniref:Radical SAM domain protein n=1 Tax=Oleidesulfovibrio alaskensis (strain ATCC BAA-1058 / DSM 17464 / G20) TaxID=207559 RepID=Q314V5_OLEA2|nr:radical SAM protein [Oleidesulfovibrio alaskensis]ABB37541.2 Radical SAM domain protein [Oleidesulfovibrio alaskensis G20]